MIQPRIERRAKKQLISDSFSLGWSIESLTLPSAWRLSVESVWRIVPARGRAVIDFGGKIRFFPETGPTVWFWNDAINVTSPRSIPRLDGDGTRESRVS